ncbi:MAG: tyrosine-type recombinase/integrase [Alphaproteobacteria bacterium]
MPLTDRTIKNLKSREKPYKLADGGGLYVMVNPTGSKLWRFAYRFGGKQRTLALGSYPDLSLAAAREARRVARIQLTEGIDPNQVKKAAKRALSVAHANTFEAVAEEYLNKLENEGRAARTVKKNRWLLGLCYGDIGRKPISEITAADVLGVLRVVEKSGRLETARRLRSTMGSVFRYAIATARAENDPTQALKGALTAPTVKHRAAITDSKEMGAMLRAIDSFDGQAGTSAALQLLPLLFPRPGELRGMMWTEIDLAKRVWTISAERMKMRCEHHVPLSTQAVEILRGQQQITGNQVYVFPSVRSVRRCMSENTLTAALRRMGYTKEEVTAHGFRATASSLLNESGLWSENAIERQLAHVDGNPVRRAYARSEYWDERVQMMQWWADALANMKTTKGSGKLDGAVLRPRKGVAS